MSQEINVRPTNYAELPPKMLLARCRRTLTNDTRLAVAELANHLAPERQAEFRPPPTESLAYIEVIVASPDRKSNFRLAYFIQPTKYHEDSIPQFQPRNKIVIQEGKLWTTGKTAPEAVAWENWQAMTTEGKSIWVRYEKTSPNKSEFKMFSPTKTYVYQDGGELSGNISFLSRAVAALENAFQVTGSRIRTLDFIDKIAWGTIVEPEKPEPPTGGGHRVPQTEKKLVPIPISIPL